MRHAATPFKKTEWHPVAKEQGSSLWALPLYDASRKKFKKKKHQTTRITLAFPLTTSTRLSPAWEGGK